MEESVGKRGFVDSNIFHDKQQNNTIYWRQCKIYNLLIDYHVKIDCHLLLKTLAQTHSQTSHHYKCFLSQNFGSSMHRCIKILADPVVMKYYIYRKLKNNPVVSKYLSGLNFRVKLILLVIKNWRI